MTIVKKAYSLLNMVVPPLLGPFFLMRPRGRSRLLERYGNWRLAADGVLWFHGASMGEINGLLPVIDATRAAYPDTPVLVTATSVTGLERAASHADYLRLLPFDGRFWIKRALAQLKVRRFVFAETEIWPGLLDYLASAGVPVFLVNARISDYTFRRYRMISRFWGDFFGPITKILAATPAAAERFAELGAAPERLAICGNAKYDLAPRVTDEQQALELRRTFFGDNTDPVLVLGSLRPEEEDLWFPAVADAIRRGLCFNLLVAPRHKEKFSFFADRLTECNLSFKRRSEREQSRIILLDTMGELDSAYSFADAAFIGGTIADWGGHNPMEAAAYGACIALGPHVQNIEDIAAALKDKNALVTVKSGDDITKLLQMLCDEPERVRAMGRGAREVWQVNAGATERIMIQIEKAASAG